MFRIDQTERHDPFSTGLSAEEEYLSRCFHYPTRGGRDTNAKLASCGVGNRVTVGVQKLQHILGSARYHTSYMYTYANEPNKKEKERKRQYRSKRLQYGTKQLVVAVGAGECELRPSSLTFTLDPTHSLVKHERINSMFYFRRRILFLFSWHATYPKLCGRFLRLRLVSAAHGFSRLAFRPKLSCCRGPCCYIYGTVYLSLRSCAARPHWNSGLKLHRSPRVEANKVCRGRRRPRLVN